MSHTPLGTAQATENLLDDDGVPRYELAEWREQLGMIAGITARGLDFRLNGEQVVAEALDHWNAFHRALGRDFPAVVVARQCHGTELALHRASSGGLTILEGKDGHLTNQPGVLVTVTVADCVPVYLCHPEAGWLGLVHAGWRGIAEGILERAVGELLKVTHGVGADIVMHCGVSICGGCYEVGPEVVEAVGEKGGTGRSHLDLRAVLLRRARRLGISRATQSRWCTAHDEARFFSHRKSAGHDGRMVAYLGAPLP